MKAKLLFFVAFAIVGCTSKTPSNETTVNNVIATTDANEQTIEVINSDPKTIGEIPLPDGFERVPIEDTTSFAYFLRNLPLKPLGTPVYYYDGSVAGTTDCAYAVIDAYQPSDEDIQQCADAIIRLRAEWLYKNARYDEIAFHFTNGWLCEYKRWADGERVSVKGNKASWYKAANVDYSYENFQKYLRTVFYYAGTLSLEKELEQSTVLAIRIGDVFIQGGTPGHSIIVVDMGIDTIISSTGLCEKCFLVAESFMPAQDIHILTNINSEKMSPWHSSVTVERSGYNYHFPTYTFSARDVKRFKDLSYEKEK